MKLLSSIINLLKVSNFPLRLLGYPKMFQTLHSVTNFPSHEMWIIAYPFRFHEGIPNGKKLTLTVLDLKTCFNIEGSDSK